MALLRPNNNSDLDELLGCLLEETEIKKKEQILTDILKIYSASRDDYHLRFSVWDCLIQINNYQLLKNLIIQDIQRVSTNQWVFMRGVDHLIAMEKLAIRASGTFAIVVEFAWQVLFGGLFVA